MVNDMLPRTLLGLSLDVIPVNYKRVTPEPQTELESMEDRIEYTIGNYANFYQLLIFFYCILIDLPIFLKTS